MSSDYIPRLRRELLRAGASRQPRWRPVRALRPLAAAAAVVAVVAVVAGVAVIALPGGGDEPAVSPASPVVDLTYRVSDAAAQPTAALLRARLGLAGVAGAHVSVAPGGRLTVTAPAAARADVAALAKPGRLAFYDWEASVLGPHGAPAPDDASVTGDPDAGHDAALSKAGARTRAARTAGARVAGVAGDRWFALGGEPALTNGDIARARAGVDEATGEPMVTLDLSTSGQTAFRSLTRELARRGTDRALPGQGHENAFQHLAIVLDDAIMAVPYIDFQQAPDGLAGAAGAVIEGGLTRQSARDIAGVLNTGPLPAALSPLPG